jgi:hypothetical protein
MTAVRVLACAGALSSWLIGGGSAGAQPATPDRPARARLEVCVAVGLFLPADESVSRVYDGTRVPWTVDGDVRLAGRFSAFAGVRSLSSEGRAVGFDPASGVDVGTTLSTRSVLFGARVHHHRGRLGLFAGVGGAWTSFTETWPGVEAEVSGSAWGPAVEGGVAFRAWRRLGIVGRVDWLRARTGQGSALDADVGLGGVDVMGGVMVRF